MGDVIRLNVKQRPPDRRIFMCAACESYMFKVVEVDGADLLSCGSCGAWIGEFALNRTRNLDAADN